MWKHCAFNTTVLEVREEVIRGDVQRELVLETLLLHFNEFQIIPILVFEIPKGSGCSERRHTILCHELLFEIRSRKPDLLQVF